MPAAELDVAALLALPSGPAQAVAAVVGVGRTPVGREGSEQRRDLAAAMAATLLRRLVRAAGVANRMAGVTAAPVTDRPAVTVHWPEQRSAAPRGEQIDVAIAAGIVRLAPWLAASADEGGLRAALREQGSALAAVAGTTPAAPPPRSR